MSDTNSFDSPPLRPSDSPRRPTGAARYDLADLHRRFNPPPGYWDGYIFRASPISRAEASRPEPARAPAPDSPAAPEPPAPLPEPDPDPHTDRFCALLAGGATWLALIGVGLLTLWALCYWAWQGLAFLGRLLTGGN